MTKIEMHRAIGRILEITVSLLLLLTIFPIIYIVMAIIVKRRSQGPAIITRRRRRDNGSEYDAYAFRVDNTESLIARTPQLINLLRGDIPVQITLTYDTGAPVETEVVAEAEATDIVAEAEVTEIAEEAEIIEETEQTINIEDNVDTE